MSVSCKSEHSDKLPADFDELPESQASRWRHKCAGCAYELGRRHGEEAEEQLRQRVHELTARIKDLEQIRVSEPARTKRGRVNTVGNS